MPSAQSKPSRTRDSFHLGKIAESHQRIAFLEPRIKLAIACAGEVPFFVERAIQAKPATTCARQQPAYTGHHCANAIPMHDVRGVGAEYAIGAGVRPTITGHIELNRLRQGYTLYFFNPAPHPSLMLSQITGLPDQLTQSWRKKNSMLTGTTTDFEDFFRFGKFLNQHIEYRLLISLT